MTRKVAGLQQEGYMYENCRDNKYFLIDLDIEVRNNGSVTKIWLCKVMSEKRGWQVTKSPRLNPPLPFKWIQLIEWSNYLNMNCRPHLSNKLKECNKFLWMCLWNHYFISVKESIFSEVACRNACKLTKCKSFTSIFKGFAKSVSYLTLRTTRNNFSYEIPSTHWTHNGNAIRRLYDDRRCINSCNNVECQPINAFLMLV